MNRSKKTNWMPMVNFLEDFFRKNSIPKGLGLDQGSTISDPDLFLETHLKTIKAQNGNPAYRVYLDRLTTIYNKLK